MSDKFNFTVGQRLWYVPSHSGAMLGREVSVLKIGTKWVQLSGGEQCEKNGRMKGGCIYLSKAHSDLMRARLAAWVELKRELRCQMMPDDLTLDELVQISAKLGLKPASEGGE